MMMVLGALAIAATVVAYLYRPLRNLERDLPDAVPDDDEAVSDRAEGREESAAPGSMDVALPEIQGRP
jgi:hypothetical protein